MPETPTDTLSQDAFLGSEGDSLDSFAEDLLITSGTVRALQISPNKIPLVRYIDNQILEVILTE